MPRTLTFHDPVATDDIARQQAAEVIEQTCDEPNLTFFVVYNGEQVEIPAQLSHFMSRVMSTLASGGEMQVRSMPEELSTTVAAEHLGISRPTLMKMIREGRIPSHMVGSHHRIRWADVEAIEARRDGERAAAANALRALGRELDQ